MGKVKDFSEMNRVIEKVAHKKAKRFSHWRNIRDFLQNWIDDISQLIDERKLVLKEKEKYEGVYFVRTPNQIMQYALDELIHFNSRLHPEVQKFDNLDFTTLISAAKKYGFINKGMK